MAKVILVVDDSPSVRQVSSLCLTRAGYEVVEACDGMDALVKLSGRRVSLIVCDVNMPKMNGLEFSGAVKQLKDHRFTPIVICTTEGKQALIDQGKALGVKAWMVKPFKPEALLDVVTKLAPL
jgi:two-component system, chemotaxis family, chemotaxis protein CheY